MSHDHYKAIPVLAAYIDRIGAEELNFKRFMVKEYKGNYYTERCLIRIEADGEIFCSNKEYAPTKAEAEAIKEAVANANWPRAVEAKNSNGLKGKTKGTLFEFWNNARNGIIMVQERRDNPKAYIPWTLFSDGEWRAMEPDRKLPFWKPAKKHAMPRKMIHEGAKAAQFVDNLIHDKEALEKHPWGKELAEFEHWGMIGGALAPHRTNYEELSMEKPLEVVYVCDNDYPGNAALQEVSRHYGGAMKGIMFDKRWKYSFDLADEMPKELFVKGRYLGPSLKDLMVGATRATELVQFGKGRPVAVMKKSFKEEWYHSVTPEVYIHKDWPNRILMGAEFNNVVAPFSDVDDTSRLIKRDSASKTAVLKYDPGRKSGIYGEAESGRYINTHVPSGIVPEKGDATPFTEFMEHLVENENDRLELMRWCATLIARPGVKMLYGVLVISEKQGIGKGTLGEKILAPLVGQENVSYPSEKEIVDSNFNYWMAHKRLAVVHEIYAGHSAKAYNQMKSIITDRYITVSKKFQANYRIENWLHVFACSNSKRAIQLSADDRRWFVPKITEKKLPASYWAELNKWLSEEGGLNIIAYWAEQFLKKNTPVVSGDGAPWSNAKNDVIEEGYSPGQALVAQRIEQIDHVLTSEDKTSEKRRKDWEAKGMLKDGQMFIWDRDLLLMIRDELHDGRNSDRLERPLTVRKVAKTKGWEVSKTKVDGSFAGEKVWGGVVIGRTEKAVEMAWRGEIHPIRLEDLKQL